MKLFNCTCRLFLGPTCFGYSYAHLQGVQWYKYQEYVLYNFYCAPNICTIKHLVYGHKNDGKHVGAKNKRYI